MWSSGTLMAASPSYFPRITEMLVPASWGENCAYINHSGKEIESQVVLLEKNQKHFWLQLQALVSHTLHQAGQVWEARAPNPGALLESIQFDCCHRNGLKNGVLAILEPPHCSLCPYPQKLMGSAHFCNLYSLGSDMTCVFLH